MPNENANADSNQQTPDAGGGDRDFQKQKELERKTKKIEEQNARIAELESKIANTQGKIEMLSGAQKKPETAEDRLQKALDMISAGRQPGGHPDDVFDGLLEMVHAVAESKSGEAYTRAKGDIEKTVAEVAFKQQYGGLFKAYPEEASKFNEMVELLGDSATAQFKERLAKNIFGDKMRQHGQAFGRMGGFVSGSGGNVEAEDDKYYHYRSDKSTMAEAKMAVSKFPDMFKNVDEYFEAKDKESGV